MLAWECFSSTRDLPMFPGPLVTVDICSPHGSVRPGQGAEGRTPVETTEGRTPTRKSWSGSSMSILTAPCISKKPETHWLRKLERCSLSLVFTAVLQRPVPWKSTGEGLFPKYGGGDSCMTQQRPGADPQKGHLCNSHPSRSDALGHLTCESHWGGQYNTASLDGLQEKAVIPAGISST